MEIVVDTRESSLWEDLGGFEYPVRQECLTIGDVWIRKDNEILMLIERKTVSDLCASLRDGRYHDQKRRWKDYQEEHPEACISLWIEGDLMSATACGMDEGLRGSLLNSMFRLQTLHRITVHHVRNRGAFILSLRVVAQKFEKDPHHLFQEKKSSPPAVIDMRRFKKSHNVDPHAVWHSTLTLIPGISHDTADHIMAIFPSASDFFQTDRETVLDRLASVDISARRRLGQKTAQKIVSLLRP